MFIYQNTLKMDTVRKSLMGRIHVIIPRLQVFIPRISRVGAGGGRGGSLSAANFQFL